MKKEAKMPFTGVGTSPLSFLLRRFEGMKQASTVEMGSTLVRLRRLMMLKFLENSDNIASPFYTSIFIEALVHLAYLLTAWQEQELKPDINFNNDIDNFKKLEKGGYSDITSLMRYFRNAACHDGSLFRKTRDETQTIAFVFQTKDGKYAGLKNYCNCDDDIAALMGDHVLYIKRHLVRAYIEIYNAMLALPRFAAYKQLIQLLIDDGR